MESSERDELLRLREENALLKQRLAVFEKDRSLHEGGSPPTTEHSTLQDDRLPSHTSDFVDDFVSSLQRKEVSRYSRQILLPQFGTEAQLRLGASSALVIGTGGLGSTAILYLAAAGIGRMGIVDFDTVDESNLHRQIIHNEQRLGQLKTESAKLSVRQINSLIQCEAHTLRFSASTALDLVRLYDVVIDASDNPQTRYLASDACVLEGKPLVSGSAVGLCGQLCVLNYRNSCCYRCLYPNEKLAYAGGSCDDNGVLGVVPGIIGCLQALQGIKVLTQKLEEPTESPTQLFFDAESFEFQKLKLPPKKAGCIACSNNGQGIANKFSVQKKQEDLASCQPKEALSSNLRCSPQEYSKIRREGIPHILLDVRDPRQYEMCHLRGAVNVPLKGLATDGKALEEVIQLLKGQTDKPAYVMCRRGIASIKATKILADAKVTNIYNVDGGLRQWAADVDPSFPGY